MPYVGYGGIYPYSPYLAVGPTDAGTWIKQGFPHCNIETRGLNFEINKSSKWSPPTHES